MKGYLVIFIVVLACAHGNPLNEDVSGESELSAKLKRRCSEERELSACFSLKVLRSLDRWLSKSQIQIGPGIELNEVDSLPIDEPRGRSSSGLSEEEQVGEIVSVKTQRWLHSRALSWSPIPGIAFVLTAKPSPDGDTSFDLTLRQDSTSGRGKMKNLGPLLAAGAMKIGMVGVLAFKALALLVGKALLVAKLAFLLAAVLGLKKLFAQQRHVTYEVVAHAPTHHADHHHDTYSSGWGRAIDVAPASQAGLDAQNLVYRAHVAQ